MKIALQIYTLRQFLGRDEIRQTLARVKEMGYDGVEWAGAPGYTPAEMAELSREAGLEIFSLFIDLKDVLEPDTDFLKQAADAGFSYIVLGWMPEEHLAGGEKFDETCKALIAYQQLMKPFGMRLLYHNHDFDLAPRGEKRALDILYEAVPAESLCAELDTCWIYSGGADPAAYLTRYADRMPLVHLKDCVKEGGRSGYRPLGRGVLDFDALLPLCKGAEWACVEQDDPSEGMDAFTCAEISAKFLLERLKKA